MNCHGSFLIATSVVIVCWGKMENITCLWKNTRHFRPLKTTAIKSKGSHLIYTFNLYVLFKNLLIKQSSFGVLMPLNPGCRKI